MIESAHPTAPAPEELRWRGVVYRVWPADIAPPTDRRMKYPWHELEPGDGIFVPVAGGIEAIRSAQGSLSASGRAWCERNRPGCTITTNAVRRGVRAWMIETPPAEEEE